MTDRCVGADSFGRVLMEVFDERVCRCVRPDLWYGTSGALASWHGVSSGALHLPGACGGAVALEHNGDLYSCDHYVEPDYLLGNITEEPLAELVDSAEQRPSERQGAALFRPTAEIAMCASPAMAVAQRTGSSRPPMARPD